MARDYIPKIGDVVFLEGQSFVRFVIAIVNDNHTVSVREVKEGRVLHHGVPWAALHHLDESENASWIVREATEHD